MWMRMRATRCSASSRATWVCGQQDGLQSNEQFKLMLLYEVVTCPLSLFAYSLTESCKLNNINPYDYWSDLIDFVGCEGIDLNSFVHSQWHKHARTA